jgi:hypothetical protein
MMRDPGYYALLYANGMRFADMLARYERDLILHFVTLDEWEDEGVRDERRVGEQEGVEL